MLLFRLLSSIIIIFFFKGSPVNGLILGSLKARIRYPTILFVHTAILFWPLAAQERYESRDPTSVWNHELKVNNYCLLYMYGMAKCYFSLNGFALPFSIKSNIDLIIFLSLVQYLLFVYRVEAWRLLFGLFPRLLKAKFVLRAVLVDNFNNI